MNVITAKHLTKKYNTGKAVDNLTFAIEGKKITGLIGRNGAGKTTLLKLIAGFHKQTSGELKVFSENPFNNLKVSSNTIFVDEHMTYPESLSIAEILQFAGTFYENWDEDLAKRLFDYFGFSKKQYHSRLSKGMRSTFNMIIGLAARCPLTILDEPTSGMDSSVRKDFYRALLKDYIEFPRAIILSSHLVNEVEDILEDIMLMKEGEIRLHKSISDIKEFAIGLQGNRETINQFTRHTEVLHESSIGNSAYVVIEKNINQSVLQNMKKAGIEVSSVATEDLCVYLTSKTKGGIDDVYNRG
ncbi:ABC transporter ATP-binding protein [Evansella sp. AB-rgal1]|uniref:ABC transporter ATP-binding protein n=1 Tax=Evansella sp. AB-rgal1 TaxID=3242696 RepID=UPI00359D00BA